MSRQVLLLVLACIAVFAAAMVPIVEKKFISVNEDDLRAEFGRFILDHKRDYLDEDEYDFRFSTFKSNVIRINGYIAQSKTATFGINKFTDRTDDEMSQLLGFRHPGQEYKQTRQIDPDYKQDIKIDPYKDIPPFDYVATKMMAHGRDQGNCGSCWAFSTVNAYESAAKKKGYPNPFDISVQHPVDCVLESRGCAGGTPEQIYDYLRDIEVPGLQSASSYPYEEQTLQCRFNASEVKIGFNYGWFTIPPCNDDDKDCSRQDGVKALKKAQELGFSSSTCVYANGAWFSYTGGLFDIFCDNYGPFLNHCVSLRGWEPKRSDSDVSKVGLVNSWGPDWGDKGTIWLKVDFEDEDFKNPCGVWDYHSYIGVPDYKP